MSDTPPAQSSKWFFFTNFWFFAAALWTGGVLFIALSPGQNPSWLVKTFGDKILHAGAFTVGCLLWAKSLETLRPLHRLWASIAGAGVALLIGVAIEILQRYVPTRTCDLRDFWADVIGVLPAVAYLVLSSRFKSKKKPQ